MSINYLLIFFHLLMLPMEAVLSSVQGRQSTLYRPRIEKLGDGTVFSYSANQITTNNYYDVSETFLCEKGAVNVSRQGYKLYTGTNRKQPPIEVTTDYDITQDSINHFIEGARTGKIINAAASAVESTLTAIMGREAIYTGKEMTWDKNASA